MSDSVRIQRRQPTRLPCPWDSPGKNTGVGCHFLLQCMKVKSDSEVAQSCPTLRDLVDCSPPGFSVHGIFQARVLEWGAIAFSIFQLTLNQPASADPNVMQFRIFYIFSASSPLTCFGSLHLILLSLLLFHPMLFFQTHYFIKVYRKVELMGNQGISSRFLYCTS